jgi:hypothetical protein
MWRPGVDLVGSLTKDGPAARFDLCAIHPWMQGQLRVG